MLAIGYILVGLPRTIPASDESLIKDSMTHIRVHTALYLPWGDQQAACALLERTGVKDDLRPILHALLRMAAQGRHPDDPAYSQCSRALKTISGENIGLSPRDWDAWLRKHDRI
jgi:hypothetical protein